METDRFFSIWDESCFFLPIDGFSTDLAQLYNYNIICISFNTLYNFIVITFTRQNKCCQVLLIGLLLS
jgi:hypothetical protein